MEIKTTEQISEDFEYENSYCKTLNDLNMLGETKWVKVEDVIKRIDKIRFRTNFGDVCKVDRALYDLIIELEK